MFSHGKVSITLVFHKYFFNRSNIYLLSSTGKRWKTISGHFVRLVLQLDAAQHWPLAVALIRSDSECRGDGDGYVKAVLVTKYHSKYIELQLYCE